MVAGELATAITEVARNLPASDLARVIAELRGSGTKENTEVQRMLVSFVAEAHYERMIRNLCAAWNAASEQVSPPSIALALESSRHAVDESTTEEVSVVCTGPSTAHVPIRRTDQVLLELIEGAQKSLWLVSFAVMNVGSVWEALRAAVDRGVDVRVLVETVEESDGKLSFDKVKELTRHLGAHDRVLVWPSENRPQDDRGRRGLLHAKCAVADTDRLFVTSANMTDFALWLNLEIGVLLTGGNAPRAVHRHLESLAKTGVIVPAD